jgi:endonuclease-3
MNPRVLRKTRAVASVLEQYLGIPRQRPPFPDPLETLIATVLSQNTNDRNSHRAYTALRTRFPSWADVERAPVRSLVSTIRTGGMANQKAARIREVLRIVRERYGWHTMSFAKSLSDDAILRELTKLNGVGTKTAACVLLFSLGRDVFPVDTHVHRVCVRLGLAKGSRSPDETFAVMRNLVPAGKAYSLHTNMIRFGRKVCRSNLPLCDLCPLYRFCEFEQKTAGIGPSRQSRASHDFMMLDHILPPRSRKVKGK